MNRSLNITNGDSAVSIMQKTGIEGDFLPWRDVLHDGPVPERKTLEELSSIRARFIADRKWGTHQDINTSFVERDNKLQTFHHYDNVILWFEHDLYDQLQLIQILDWFHDRPLNGTSLSIICTDHYLGQLTPEDMKSLVSYKRPITKNELSLAKQAWSAFKQDTPQSWSELLKKDTTALPFLKGAILRMLQEFPNPQNGLSRTEQQALAMIAKGRNSPWDIFDLNQRQEERIFLGDLSFWHILNTFLNSSPALITASNHQAITSRTAKDLEINITKEGKDVLSGKLNWLDIHQIDRWIGGTHLISHHIWCWDGNNMYEVDRS